MTSLPNPDPDRPRSSRANLVDALCWLGIALLAAGAWAALPRTRSGSPRAPLEIVLVDVSKSVVGPRGSEWTRFVRDDLAPRAGAARARGADLCVVGFGSEVRTLAGPASAQAILDRLAEDPRAEGGIALLERGAPAGAGETRLAAALDLASTLAADRTQASIVILGDGTYTGRDPAPAAAALQRAGVGVAAATGDGEIIPAQRTDIGLGPLTVPRAIERDAPLVVSFEAWIAPAGDAHGPCWVDIVRRDLRGAVTTRVDLELPAGSLAPAIVPVHADLGPAIPGMIEIEARAIVADASGKPVADAIPENDASSARVHCAGTLSVGVVDAEGLGAQLYAMLQRLAEKEAPPGGQRDPFNPPGLQIVALRTGDLPLALHALDAVVTVDDPLGDDAAQLLAAFVRSGGGWLDVAGWSWIARRARPDGPLASIAPLAPARKALGPRDVILLVDASGSMSGAPFESVRAALPAVLDAALPEDDLEVRFFADDVSAPVRLSAAERADPLRRREFLERVLATREPLGSTHLWRALERLADERTSPQPTSAQRDALVILLSDGRDPDNATASTRGPALRARLAQVRTRLGIVAAGTDPDRELLASLLAPGETMQSAGDLAAPGAAERLARCFARDIAREQVRTGPLEVIAASSGTALAADIARAAGTPPPIARSVRAEIAHASEVLFATADGEPLGALARAGSGLAASLAFQPDSDWAPDWLDAAPLAPLVRALARNHVARTQEPFVREDEDRLCLENPPADLPAPAVAHVSDGRGGTAEVLFADAGAGGDPMRERCAPVPADLDRSAGFWTVSIVTHAGTTDTGAGPPLVLALATPRAPEFTLPPRRFHPQARPVQERAPIASEAPLSSAPWILASGTLALFAAALLGAFSRPRER